MNKYNILLNRVFRRSMIRTYDWDTRFQQLVDFINFIEEKK